MQDKRTPEEIEEGLKKYKERCLQRDKESMEKHGHISQKNVIEAYQQPEKPKEEDRYSYILKKYPFLEDRRGRHDCLIVSREVKHLSNKDYQVSFNPVYKAYEVYNNKKNKMKRIPVSDVEPKSVREQLRNIEESKKFYEPEN